MIELVGSTDRGETSTDLVHVGPLAKRHFLYLVTKQFVGSEGRAKLGALIGVGPDGKVCDYILPGHLVERMGVEFDAASVYENVVAAVEGPATGLADDEIALRVTAQSPSGDISLVNAPVHDVIRM